MLWIRLEDGINPQHLNTSHVVVNVRQMLTLIFNLQLISKSQQKQPESNRTFGSVGFNVFPDNGITELNVEVWHCTDLNHLKDARIQRNAEVLQFSVVNEVFGVVLS